MKKLSTADKIVYIFWIIPAGGFLAFIIVGTIVNYVSLSKHTEYTYGVITEFYRGAKGRNKLDYEFEANGKIYKHNATHYSNDSLSVGDSIIVMYDRTNPKMSLAWRDYENDKFWFKYIIFPAVALISLYYWWKWRRRKKQKAKS
jgi:hypothetical protein